MLNILDKNPAPTTGCVLSILNGPPASIGSPTSCQKKFGHQSRFALVHPFSCLLALFFKEWAGLEEATRT